MDTKTIHEGFFLSKMGLKETCEFKCYIYSIAANVILPIIRRVMPAIIANDIIGVQPMTGPIGQIHTLKTRYEKDFDA